MNPKSSKGLATKARIIEAAIALVYSRGANSTSVDEILKASGTGKSQFYHYFKNKDALLVEIVNIQSERFPGKALQNFNFASADGIATWLLSIRQDFAGGLYKSGCPIGNLAIELSYEESAARDACTAVLKQWETVVAKGLRTQKTRGLLKAGCDSNQLAMFIISSIEGALLMAKSLGTHEPLDGAINLINSIVRGNSQSVGARASLPKQSSLGFCP